MVNVNQEWALFELINIQNKLILMILLSSYKDLFNILSVINIF
jgi:hypothetical protein